MNQFKFDLSGLPQHTLVALPPLARLRFQVPLVFCLCALLPAALVGGIGELITPLPLTSISNAFYASTICCIAGLLFFRRLGSFPGITSFGQVGTAVAGPYTLAIVIIVATRLNYSRPILLLSATLAAAVFFGLWLYCRRRCAPTIYAVPGTSLATDGMNVVAADPLIPPNVLERNPVVVANLHLDLAPEWENFLLQCALSGVPVYHEKHLKESITGRVEVQHLSENSFGSLSPNQLYLRAKRAFDLAASIVVLPLLLPVFAVVAVLIKVDSRGPVFFVQQRMGFRGEPFRMVKFRSMVTTEQVSNTLSDEKTQTRDVRITAIGRHLRRYRLDELPQIFNILQGDMSWIGPRPEACRLSEWYAGEIPFYGYRHIVRPGITGWAQVHQGHVHEITDVRDKLQYDFYYIKYFSWWLDALIILRTVRTLLVGNGAR